jgi:NADH dehydrogenase [ubiquinone] 1 alpha subcomplex assembly factor 1
MRAVFAAVIVALSGQVATQEALQLVLDFACPDTAQKWQAVNDGVMGGVSDGRFRITNEKTLEFFGTLSLESNGGFASVRTKPTD